MRPRAGLTKRGSAVDRQPTDNGRLDPAAFRSPPAAYRGAPLWSWNGRLEANELRRQIGELAAGGFGGFFMHPRPGLETAFLSEEWFAAVRVSVEEAQRLGISAWIYDECSYPSGFAGGLVPQRYPELRAKALTCHLAARGDAPLPLPSPEQGAHVAAFVARVAPGRSGLLRDYRRLAEGEDVHRAQERLGADGALLVFSWWYMGPQTWFNDSAYVDTLDPRTAAAFVEVAYEPYVARFKEQIGGGGRAAVIPGAFSDEPHFSPFATGMQEAFSWPWTPSLPERFAADRSGERGRLVDRLPELAFDLEEPGADPPTALRYRFWSTCTRQFANGFMRPIGDWCVAHGLVWTGHCWEHVLDPMHTGSLMLPLTAMRMPGIDLLGPDRPLGKLPGQRVRQQAGQAQMVKTASSVAHQLGRERVLSETYGGGGWDLTFEGQKRMAEWQAALGVNFLNPHLSHYSLRGYRKRDYPPSFQGLEPWWPEFPHLQDALARLYYALSQGRFRAEVAVLHPITSTWLCRPTPRRQHPLATGVAETDRALAKALDSLVKDLLAAQWGFDFLDEPLVPELAQADGGGLVVGEMRYGSLVLPSCRNLAPETAQLLHDLLDGGCPIYAVAPLPDRVAGALDPELASLWQRVRVCAGNGALLAALADAPARTAIVPDPPPGVVVYAHVRDLGREGSDARAIYLLNTGEGEAEGVAVALPGLASGAAVQEWDLFTGGVQPLAVERGATPIVRLDFARGQSHLLLVAGSGSDEAGTTPGPAAVARGLVPRTPPPDEVCLADTWTIRRASANALTLDRAQLRWGDGAWGEPEWLPVLQAQVRERLGWGNQGFREAHPWRKFANQPPRRAETPLTLRWRCAVGAGVPSDVVAATRLAAELAEGWELHVNGEAPACTDERWLSHGISVFAAGPLLHPGENWIELRGTYAEDFWLEAAYLLGDFGAWPVAGTDFADGEGGTLRLPLGPDGWPAVELAPAPGTLREGAWTAQGYPFFAGRLVAAQTVTLLEAPQEAWLAFEHTPCALRVRCNGTDAGVIAWRPYRLPLRGLHAGANEIELEVASSLRNLLGPLHADLSQAAMVGPNHFLPGPHWRDAYLFTPEGLPTHGSVFLVSRRQAPDRSQT